MRSRLLESLESWLFARGFTHPEVRKLVRNQICLALAAIFFAPLALFNVPSLSFLAGVWLATINFWFLAKFGQQLVHMERKAVLALLSRFYLRLALTAAALFVLIVWGGASAVALLVGISSVVVNFLHWAAFRCVGSKVKEA